MKRIDHKIYPVSIPGHNDSLFTTFSLEVYDNHTEDLHLVIMEDCNLRNDRSLTNAAFVAKEYVRKCYNLEEERTTWIAKGTDGVYSVLNFPQKGYADVNFRYISPEAISELRELWQR